MNGESASCVSDRGFSPADDGAAGVVGSYDPVGCVQDSWNAVATRAYVAGSFAWAGFDYGGESSWPAVSSHYGIIDLCGFAKPSYEWYATWWGVEAGRPGAAARVFAYPDWQGTPGAGVRVVAFAAGASVRAFVNGAPQGSAPTPMPPRGFVSWPAIPFTPGNLTVVSYDASGAAVGAWTSLTAGAPAALRAVVDWPGGGAGGALLADGADAALVAVAVVDAAGVVVPSARVNVTLAVSGAGALLGAGNGDPACHLPRQGVTVIPSYAGRLRAVLRAASGGGGGAVTLDVSAPGLAGARVTVPVVSPSRDA